MRLIRFQGMQGSAGRGGREPEGAWRRDGLGKPCVCEALAKPGVDRNGVLAKKLWPPQCGQMLECNRTPLAPIVSIARGCLSAGSCKIRANSTGFRIEDVFCPKQCRKMAVVVVVVVVMMSMMLMMMLMMMIL